VNITLDDRDGFVKFLVNREDRKILGCHIIGTDASILIHEVLVAMRTGDNTIDSISRTIHIHPALSEVISRAEEANLGAPCGYDLQMDRRHVIGPKYIMRNPIKDYYLCEVIINS
jgi:hypothetical protein